MRSANQKLMSSTHGRTEFNFIHTIGKRNKQIDDMYEKTAYDTA